MERTKIRVELLNLEQSHVRGVMVAKEGFLQLVYSLVSLEMYLVLFFTHQLRGFSKITFRPVTVDFSTFAVPPAF